MIIGDINSCNRCTHSDIEYVNNLQAFCKKCRQFVQVVTPVKLKFRDEVTRELDTSW